MSYRFLLDENVPRSIYRLLEQMGFHVVYVPQGVSDRTVIRLARERGGSYWSRGTATSRTRSGILRARIQA